jgi:hypothetical protein
MSSKQNSIIEVADAIGKVTLLSSKFETLHQSDFGCEITHLNQCKFADGWSIGGADGELRIYGLDLKIKLETKFSGYVNDVYLSKIDGRNVVYVAAGEEPIKQFNIIDDDGQLKAELFQELEMPNRRPGVFSSQVTFDSKRKQIIALDSQNDVHIWNAIGGKHTRTYSIGARLDIRKPALNKQAKIDVLEKRAGGNLRWIDNNLLFTNQIGDMKLASRSEEAPGPKWKKLSLELGATPELAADPEIPNRVWAMDNEGELSLIDLARDKLIASVPKAHAGGRQAIVILSNGDVATVGNDQWVKVWRLSKGKIKEVRRIKSTNSLVSLAIHEGKDLVAAVDSQSTIQLWTWSDGKHLKTLHFPGVPKDKDIAQEQMKVFPINTGKIAFSSEGKYLAAYGAGQNFATFRTRDFSVADLGMQQIASAGGTALVFSSVRESRMLTADENSVAPNWIDNRDKEDHRNFQIRRGLDLPGARDFTVTHDGLRIVSLSKNGEIGLCTPEHMVSVSTINCPSRNGHSIAVAATDAAITVANQDGSLIWCPLEKWEKAAEVKQVSDGVVHWIQKPDSHFVGRSGDHNLTLSQAQHLEQPFIMGSLTMYGKNNRLHLLEKTEGIWELNQIRFDGEEVGPCSQAKLFYSPSGKRVMTVRQLQPDVGAFAGRLLLLYESAAGKWKSETVIDSANSGFWPILRFDENENVDQIYFGDYGTNQLVVAKRRDGGWETSSVRGNVGVSLRGQFDNAGNPHLLTKRWTGRDNYDPSFYISSKQNDEFSYQHVFGSLLLLDSTGKKTVFDQASDSIHTSMDGDSWKRLEFARFTTKNMTIPSIDEQDRIWFAECLGDRIVYQTLHDEKWTTGMLKLDQKLPRGCICLPRLRKDGVLEIMAYHPLDDGFLAVVESFDSIAEDKTD